MDYNFEQFTEFKGKFTPIISLGKTGGFGFSTGFVERNKLGEYKYIKVFYDKLKNAVAFNFQKEKTEGAVKFKNRGTGGYFSSKSFIGKYNIDPKKYQGRYTPKKIEVSNVGEVYVIELKDRNTDKQIDNKLDNNSSI